MLLLGCAQLRLAVVPAGSSRHAPSCGCVPPRSPACGGLSITWQVMPPTVEASTVGAGGEETDDGDRAPAAGRRAAAPVAPTPTAEPARAGQPGGDLHQAPELCGDRPVGAQPRDAAAPGRAAGGAAAGAQPAATGGRLRPGVRPHRLGR